MSPYRTFRILRHALLGTSLSFGLGIAAAALAGRALVLVVGCALAIASIGETMVWFRGRRRTPYGRRLLLPLAAAGLVCGGLLLHRDSPVTVRTSAALSDVLSISPSDPLIELHGTDVLVITRGGEVTITGERGARHGALSSHDLSLLLHAIGAADFDALRGVKPPTLDDALLRIHTSPTVAYDFDRAMIASDGDTPLMYAVSTAVLSARASVTRVQP